jgi:DNA-binding transcriptional regulator YdaS (Cro superfamily)
MFWRLVPARWANALAVNPTEVRQRRTNSPSSFMQAILPTLIARKFACSMQESLLSNRPMTTPSALQRAIAHCDNKPAELARRIGSGVVRQNVEYWVRTGRVPVERCAAIERASDFTVRRWDLRPTDWHQIWPELIGVEGAPTVPADEVRDAA